MLKQKIEKIKFLSSFFFFLFLCYVYNLKKFKNALKKYKKTAFLK